VPVVGPAASAHDGKPRERCLQRTVVACQLGDVADVDLGRGVTVTRVVSAEPAVATVEVTVAADAPEGARDLFVAGAVRPAALIAHESANIVKLQIGGDGDAGVTVSANAEVGDHVGQVEAAVEGDGTTIAFNARYLADVLTNVSADQFALELNGPLSPGVFKPVGDDRYVHVVMPVRTTS